jgi:arylsulfatase A-like enzyme
MPQRQPDIILLILDTQRADRLGCYGYPLPTSPQLDLLAQRSTLFSNAVAAAQWTIPSHASMFTGTYPAIHNMVQSYSVLPQTLPTLAERLQAAGYYTAGFCNNPLVGVINNGLRRGFYSFLNYSGLLTANPNQAGTPSNFIDRYRQGFKRLLAYGLNRLQDAFARNDMLLALSLTPLMVPLWQTALSFKGNTAKSLEDAARLLIDRPNLDADRPIFCFINLMGTHMPYNPPRRYIEQFAPHVLRDRSQQLYLRNFNSDIYGWLAPLADPLNADRKATLDGMYNAEVAHQDALIGKFIDRLAQNQNLDRTMLVVSSDHGEHLGEKQLVGHCNGLYNELVHVPLIISTPGNDFPASKQNQVVSTRRIFHTLLTAANCASDAEQKLSLCHTSDADDGRVFAEAIPPQNAINLLMKRQPELLLTRGYDQTRRACWAGEYKIVAAENGNCELYNIFADTSETLNLSDVLPEQVEMLQDLIDLFNSDRHHEISLVGATAKASNIDDPEVYRRLRDLGYLE